MGGGTCASLASICQRARTGGTCAAETSSSHLRRGQAHPRQVGTKREDRPHATRKKYKTRCSYNFKRNHYVQKIKCKTSGLTCQTNAGLATKAHEVNEDAPP